MAGSNAGQTRKPKGGAGGLGEVLPGPRQPVWGCPGCGRADNWASRIRCRCGHAAPGSVVVKARAAAKKFKKDGGPAGSSREAAEAKRLRKELEETKAANAKLLKQVAGSGPEPPGEGDGSPGDGSDAKRLRELFRELRSLRAVPDDVRKRNGIDRTIVALEAEKVAIEKARRGAKPPDERLEKSRAFEKKLEGDIEKAAAKKVELDERRRELEREAAELDEHMGKLRGQLQEVRSEVADILASLAKDKASASGGGAPPDVPTATADSVRSFFGFLAPRVASHPDGQERINTVMRLLDELLQASKQAAGGPAAAEVPGGPAAAGGAAGCAGGALPEAAAAGAADTDVAMPELELDDEQALLLVEQVAPPKADDEEEDQFRARIKASAARLKSGRLRLDGRKLLVRKPVNK